MDKPLLKEVFGLFKKDPTSLGLMKFKLPSEKLKGLKNLAKVLSKEQLIKIYNIIKEMQ